MSTHQPVQRVAIVGTGTIGASWATHYLARGFEVTATDPSPTAEAALRSFVEAAWDGAASVGLAPGASPDRLSFTADLPQAVADADFVQENAPERPDLKVRLFADIDDATPPETIIASSSSGITMSVIQAQCRRPERTVIGHPFNPPHIIPLVEVVGGTRTAPETIRDAMSFYAAIGKKPIHLKKELPGHVANRIQVALYREVVYLVQEGVLDVADSDDAVCWGPGLRWGVMGPHMLWHLGGGEGGIQHFMDTLMPRMVESWQKLGTPEFTPALQETIVNGVLEEAGGHAVEDLAARRDAMLAGLLAVRAQHDRPARRAPRPARRGPSAPEAPPGTALCDATRRISTDRTTEILVPRVGHTGIARAVPPPGTALPAVPGAQRPRAMSTAPVLDHGQGLRAVKPSPASPHEGLLVERLRVSGLGKWPGRAHVPAWTGHRPV
ncbi:3-hydroxyacyl-CoA dehydrogenase NAD-binding domain-containing protein [Peterkaempfera sp. SMS 1(5)a]|uniref:3-hydroxyacyl-CoA dehydrogenase NAD-binding domain-containing protein n=1 Tax=Peterkaempfera podocarpi TaxID=3232308 RepID=UPI0036701037